jgi:hypothetical protein
MQKMHRPSWFLSRIMKKVMEILRNLKTTEKESSLWCDIMCREWGFRVDLLNERRLRVKHLISTVKPVLNGISKVQNIFPLKPGFRLIAVHVYYDSHGTWKYFHLIKGPFRTGFTVFTIKLVPFALIHLSLQPQLVVSLPYKMALKTT